MNKKYLLIALPIVLIVLALAIYKIIDPEDGENPSETNLVSECIEINKNWYLGKIVEDVDNEVIGFDPPDVMTHFADYSWGDAINSSTDRLMKRQILKYEGKDISTEILNKGNTGFGEMKIVESKSELAKTLNIKKELELKVKYGLYDGKLNVKETFYQESKNSNYNQNAVYKAEYTNEPKKLINYELNEEVRELANNNPIEFLKTYGDRIVTKRVSGGTAFAMFELSKKSDELEKKNKLFIQSVNKIYGQELNAKFEKEKTLKLKNELEILNSRFYTSGGDSIPTPNNFSSFIDLIKGFRKSVSESGSPSTLYVISEPIETIEGIDSKIDFAHIRIRQKKYIELYDRMIDSLNKAKANCDFVQKHLEYFSEEDQERAIELNDAITGLIPRLRLDSEKCINDFESCSCENLQPYNIDISYNPKPIRIIPTTTYYNLPIKKGDFIELFRTPSDEPRFASIDKNLNIQYKFYQCLWPKPGKYRLEKEIECFLPVKSNYIDLGERNIKEFDNRCPKPKAKGYKINLPNWIAKWRIETPYYQFKVINNNGQIQFLYPNQDNLVKFPENSIILVKLVIPTIEEWNSRLDNKWHPKQMSEKDNKFIISECVTGKIKLEVTNIKPTK